MIRGDIKGYYASISRPILLRQLNEQIQDPRLQNYFEQIVHAPIDNGGHLTRPDCGISRSLSIAPFLAAVYLKPLDDLFANAKGVFYVRYNDDFVILTKTPRQYRRAKKRLYAVLEQLQLTLSPSKTYMGKLSKFHFLGISLEVAQTPQAKSTEAITVSMHSRSCERALVRVQTLHDDAVSPATKRRYLSRWSQWWANAATALHYEDNLHAWITHVRKREPTHRWVAMSLLS